MRRLLAVLMALLPAAARADDLADVWRGKTITIVVGTSAGGGYDEYARMLARFLGRHVPGNPGVIVTNMAGAASNTMAGYIANVAPKDGTFIGASFSTLPLGPVLDEPGSIRYDAKRLNYIGSANVDSFLCIVRKDAPATTFADAFVREDVMGGTAETGSTGYLPLLLNNVLGTKFKVVFGYPGSREIIAAVEKGELNGACGMGWSSMTTQYKELLASGRVIVLVQEGMKGQPDMDRLGAPVSADFAKTGEQRAILEIIYSQEVFGRPYFVAPDVAPERVAALRKAFMDAWRDPEAVAEAKRIGLESTPIAGEELQALLQRIYASPPDLQRKAREAIHVKR
jgi:tripartite-type tricarboxylate transporter receptor subunit TctC